MTPMYSKEDRNAIIRGFIALRGKGEVPISDFRPLVRYLNDAKIKKLCFLKPASMDEVKINGETNYLPVYDEENAEDYFNWLITTISIGETVTEKEMDEAQKQLFLFIFALRDRMHTDLDIFLKVRFEWQDRIDAFDRSLTDLKQSFDNSEHYNDRKHDELSENIEAETQKITGVLERIRNWQEEYQPYLNRLKKEQEGLEKALKGVQSGKKGKR